MSDDVRDPGSAPGDDATDAAVTDPAVADPAVGDPAAADAAGEGGPDLARAALAAAKARARLRPSEQERLDAAARRADRRRGQRDRRRRDAGDPLAFSDAIDGLLRARGWQQQAAAAAVSARWDALVGDPLADKCRPQSLTDGELVVVAVSTAWATQLRLLLPQLRARLNRELGADTVRSIRVQGPGGARRTPGGWRVRGSVGDRDTYG